MASLTTRDAVPLTKPGTDTLAAVREQIAAEWKPCRCRPGISRPV